MNNNSEEKHRKDLEAAKNWYKIAEQQNNEVAMNILKDLFPELNESRNIGIQLLNAIKSSARLEDCLQKHGFKIKEILNWLEKQIERKSNGWSEDDELSLKNAILASEKEWGLDSFTAKWLKSIKDRVQPQSKQGCSEDDERIRKEIIAYLDVQDAISNRKDQDFKDWIAWLKKQDNNEDLNILQRFSFYSYKDEPNILYLSGLYVNDEYRNKGIGTKILRIADEVAKSLNCCAIRLKTKSGSDAERLYKENGYNTLKKEGNQVWLEKQTPILQDTEVRDIWVYIKEWKEKFGRLPKDEDELASCIDYVSKRQKYAEWSEEDENLLNLSLENLTELKNRFGEKYGKIGDCIHWFKSLKSRQNSQMIQWKGDNLKEVIEFTGKSPKFNDWFKTFEEYETYVSEHNNIFKLFNEDGSHYEVPVGAWIVKTPDGYNVASKAIFKQKNGEWTEEDEKNWRHCLHYIDAFVTPVKEHVDWFKNIRNRIQPKQEWSDKDEKMLNEIVLDLKLLKNKDAGEEGKAAYQREIDWLKSLKPQNHWKPSDLQLEALESAYKQLPNIQHFLQSLYNDLKNF